MVGLLVGGAVGALVAWLFARLAQRDLEQRVRAPMSIELAAVRERLAAAESERERLQEHTSSLAIDLAAAQATAHEAVERRATSDGALMQLPALEQRLRQVLEGEAAMRVELEQRLAASQANETTTRAALEIARVESARLAASLEAEARSAEQQRAAFEALRDEHEQLTFERDDERQRVTEFAVARSALGARVEELQLDCTARREAEERLHAALDEERVRATRLAAELAAARDDGAVRDLALASGAKTRTELEEALVTTRMEERSLRTQLEAERRRATEQLAHIQETNDATVHRFEVLASAILEEKSKRFTEQNQVNLGQLLEPLKERLVGFQSKVEEVYVREGQDRAKLEAQVKQLFALNQTLSEDAKNLTSALKGSSRTQGAWGELVLERILEASGLRAGHEFDLQVQLTRRDGTHARPDVIVRLPSSRDLIIDAKVSLTAYEEYCSTTDESAREGALRRHIDSVRSHIRALGEKSYHDLPGVRSLDFVAMFVPLEPAFFLATQNDESIFTDAMQRNVLIVTPSTLLFVVRTVAHLWRQEAQARNAHEIAKRGAELYDRLVAFVSDLQHVREHLGRAQTAYDSAEKRLSTGKGNVIRQAEMLRELGVKPNKSLPTELIELVTTEPALPEST